MFSFQITVKSNYPKERSERSTISRPTLVAASSSRPTFRKVWKKIIISASFYASFHARSPWHCRVNRLTECKYFVATLCRDEIFGKKIPIHRHDKFNPNRGLESEGSPDAGPKNHRKFHFRWILTRLVSKPGTMLHALLRSHCRSAVSYLPLPFACPNFQSGHACSTSSIVDRLRWARRAQNRNFHRSRASLGRAMKKKKMEIRGTSETFEEILRRRQVHDLESRMKMVLWSMDSSFLRMRAWSEIEKKKVFGNRRRNIRYRGNGIFRARSGTSRDRFRSSGRAGKIGSGHSLSKFWKKLVFVEICHGRDLNVKLITRWLSGEGAFRAPRKYFIYANKSFDEYGRNKYSFVVLKKSFGPNLKKKKKTI